MGGKKVGIALTLLGIVVIIVALVLKFTIVEGMKQWPDDVDTTRYYEGELNTMLNAEALAEMDVLNVFVHDVPVDISRHYTTEETNGTKAIVREIITMAGPNEEAIMATDKFYAIDRKTMEAVPGFCDEYDVPDREGLAFQFPIGAKDESYNRWVSDLQTTVEIAFLEEEERGGISCYVYESVVEPGEIVDPSVLGVLPSTLPKSLLSMMAMILDLPDDKKAALDAILPNLPEQVPLKYVYEYNATYWIEPTTGMNIDVQRHEVRSAALEIGEQLISLTPVFDVDYQSTEASIEEAVDDARAIKDDITLWGSTVPYILIAFGAVLGIFGILLISRRQL